MVSSAPNPTVNDVGEPIERRFDPRYDAAHSPISRDQLVVYTPAKRVSQLQMMLAGSKTLKIDTGTVVVAIDGACRGNGTSAARASWGVYFGPQSPLNTSGLLDSDLPQTNSRAEIEALWQCLRIIQSQVSRDFSLTRFRIMSDSEYLVRAMSEWIEDWVDNKGRNHQGQAVAHFEKLEEIHELVDKMTYGDDGGMEFKFWHVPREQNKEADALANSALDNQ